MPRRTRETDRLQEEINQERLFNKPERRIKITEHGREERRRQAENQLPKGWKAHNNYLFDPDLSPREISSKTFYIFNGDHNTKTFLQPTSPVTKLSLSNIERFSQRELSPNPDEDSRDPIRKFLYTPRSIYAQGINRKRKRKTRRKTQRKPRRKKKSNKRRRKHRNRTSRK